MSEIRIGFIGVGSMGSVHLRALKALSGKGVDVVAYADVREERRAFAASLFPNAHAYSSGMDLLESEKGLTACWICVPTYLHAAHILKAFSKGLDVFSEKPLCRTEEELEAVLRAERESGKKAMVGQVLRFYAEHQAIQKAIDEELFGKTLSVSLERLSNDPTWSWEDWYHDDAKSGSVALDLSIHDLDLLRYEFGEPTLLYALGEKNEKGCLNHETAFLEYPKSKIHAQVEAAWYPSASYPFTTIARYEFERGAIVFSNLEGKVMAYPKEGKAYPIEVKKNAPSLSVSGGFNLSDLGDYFYEDEYFIECLKGGKSPERARFADGAESVRLGLKVRALAFQSAF